MRTRPTTQKPTGPDGAPPLRWRVRKLERLGLGWSSSLTLAQPYATAPPKLTCCPLVALLGSHDEMWPSEVYIERWGEVADAGFRAVTVTGVPHHQLQSHEKMRDEIYGELAVIVMQL